jgi:hypothetical protein
MVSSSFISRLAADLAEVDLHAHETFVPYSLKLKDFHKFDSAATGDQVYHVIA